MLTKMNHFGMNGHATTTRNPWWKKTGKSEIEKSAAHDRKKQEQSKEEKK